MTSFLTKASKLASNVVISFKCTVSTLADCRSTEFEEEKLPTHRDLILPINSGQDVVAPVYMHRDAHLCLFTFIFLALTGVIAGTPNPVNFPPVWMVFIIYVATRATNNRYYHEILWCSIQ
jgi:hypothetical protein